MPPIYIGNKIRQDSQPQNPQKPRCGDHIWPYGHIRRMENVPMGISRCSFSENLTCLKIISAHCFLDYDLGSPSPVRLCCSCLRCFGDLRNKVRPGTRKQSLAQASEALQVNPTKSKQTESHPTEQTRMRSNRIKSKHTGSSH